MLVRIPQRIQDDCAICAVAMVMGAPYSYERVLADSTKYPKTSPEGKFSAWWETYFHSEGFESIYCHFGGWHALRDYAGSVVGLLGMDIRHLKMGRIVAIDEIGVLDSADNAPEHVALADYVYSRIQDGVVFHKEWLAVRKLPANASSKIEAPGIYSFVGFTHSLFRTSTTEVLLGMILRVH